MKLRLVTLKKVITRGKKNNLCNTRIGTRRGKYLANIDYSVILEHSCHLGVAADEGGEKILEGGQCSALYSAWSNLTKGSTRNIYYCGLVLSLI